MQLKLKLLLKAFGEDFSISSINILKQVYCNEMLSGFDIDSQSTQGSRYQIFTERDDEVDLIEEVKYYKKVLNRKQIKLASARLVEEYIKKDE